ncbi:phage antirepressor KilAC domain-containing protein [Peptostreptococcus faecalis]|uniref:phage antirepressor KilAC domain-containing protein n=1 Tax=Peptostreptococcus faecalis TaxID=2045015 RepID=UPI000C7C2127|nr:phage antirepressor KilAC domain-containing protein [Peptostreptococcus faecalis]
MELIKVETNENMEPVVSGRELHSRLEINTPYVKWFDRMKEYGFIENQDFIVTDIFVPNSKGGKQNQVEHILKMDMAKEIAMLQRNEKGKEIRQYFIAIEKEYNSPEKIMQRALIYANSQVKNLQIEVEENKPKVLFADSVQASKKSILVGDLAKLIKQNGVDIGQNRLFDWMRNKGFLIGRKGESYNMPTQKSMDLGVFEIKESIHVNSDGSTRLTKTPKVTGKGQVYFVNKFLSN